MKTGGCQHVTGWTCKPLGSQPVMPKNLPDLRCVNSISGAVAVDALACYLALT